MPKPNVRMGDWVHYHFSAGIGQPLVTMPALVTSVHPGTDVGRRVTLEAFHPSRGIMHLGGQIPYAELSINEHWGWPPWE